MRLFLALALPETIRYQLLVLADESLPLRWQHDEQLHLTLRYIGEVDRHGAADLLAALGNLRVDPIELSLSGLGRFDRRRSGTLWIGAHPREALSALAARAERLCQQAGMSSEYRAFHPHVTLARWNGRAPELAPLLATFAGLVTDGWTANEVTLFESHLGKGGAHYEPVAVFGNQATPIRSS